MKIFKSRWILFGVTMLISIWAQAQEVCDDGIDNDGDGLIDCYDPDCYASDECGFYDADYCRSILPDSKAFGMQLKNNFLAGNYQIGGSGAVYNYAPYGYAIPKVADIDNDGNLEIAVVGANSGDDGIFIFDPVNDNLKYFIPLVLANNHTGVTLANIDTDPYVEIIIATGYEGSGDSKIYRYDFDGINWNQYISTGWPIINAYTRRGFQPDVVDFNEDGIVELFFYGEQYGSKTAKIYNVETGELIVDLIAQTGGNGGHLASHLYWKDHYAYADIIPAGFNPGTGVLQYADGVEVITGGRIYTIDIATGNVEDVWGADPVGIHKPWQNGDNRHLETSFTLDNDAGQKVALGDINVDGNLDIVVTGNGYISIWNPLTNTALCAPHKLGSSESKRKGGIACIGDVDNDPDNQPEIGVVSSKYVEVFRLNGMGSLERVWGLANSDGSGETACNFFDFEGDGSVEMVYRDTYDLWVYEGEGDGAGGEKVLLTSNQAYNDSKGWITNVSGCSSGTGSEHPVIVDVDKNNRADIVVCCSEGLRVYRDRLTPWIASRGLFNQRSYSYVNINDDMSVPAKMQQNHIVPSLNNYLTQMYRIDKAGNPFYPAPDFTVEVKSVYDLCHGAQNDRVNFVLNIFNYGDGHADLFEVPITFYDGDPSKPGARVLKKEIVTVDLMPLNAKETHVFDIMMSKLTGDGNLYDGEIYITINDNINAVADGSFVTTTPTVLPNSPYPECNYANNTIGPFIFRDCMLMVPLVDLDADDNNTGGYYSTDYTTNYPEDGGNINISDIDVKITDDGTEIASAHIEIYNPLDGEIHEGLFWDNNALELLGITAIGNQGDLKIYLSGVRPIADYESAIELFQYNNTSDFPNTEDRMVVVRVVDADNGLESGSAVCHFKLSGVNDAPSTEDKTITTETNVNYKFTGNEFAFSDPDGDSFRKIKVATLTSKGKLFKDSNLNNVLDGGEALSANTEIAINELYAGLLKFEPVTGEAGVLASDYLYTTFTFTVSDGNIESDPVSTLAIRVLPDNFLPTAADNTLTTDEDTDIVFTAAQFNFNDVDVSDQLFKIQLVSTPGGGILYYDVNSNGIVDTNEVLSSYDEVNVTIIDSGLLKYKPGQHEFGTPYTYFQFKVNDAVQYSSDYYKMTINVNPIEDDPVIEANSVSVNEGHTGLVIAATSTDGDAGDTKEFSISGTDAADFTIDKDSGVLIFVAAPDFEMPADANGDNVYELTITVRDGTGRTDFSNVAVTVINIIDALSLEFSAIAYQDLENKGGNLPVVVVGGEVLPTSVTVKATVSGGTATATTDYAHTVLLTIPAGDYKSADQNISLSALSIVDDNLAENDETIVFALSEATSGVTIRAKSTATYTILNDDIPSITLSLLGSPIDENGGEATLTATSDIESVNDIIISLANTGSATVISDYTSAGTITIPAGQLSASIKIIGVEDSVDEPNETVITDISGVTNGDENGTQQVTTIIIDDDDAPGVSLTLDKLSLAEDGGIATVTASIATASSYPVTINLGYSGTASLSGVDATTAGGNNAVSTTQIVIPAGATSGSISITSVDDLLDENDETVMVAITSVVNAIEATEQQVTVTITDDDTPPNVTLATDKTTIEENGGVATVTAALDAVSALPVTINLAYSGTASLGGTDATTAMGSNAISTTQLIIPAGATTGSISITATHDLLDENDETVMVAITSVVNAIESTEQQVTTTITDDDSAPNVSLTIDKISIVENGGVATVSALLDVVSGLPVTVNLEYSGTASLSGVDATTTAGTNAASAIQLIIPAGARYGAVLISAEQDQTDEVDETVIVAITSVLNAIEATEQQVTTTITDDDDAPNVTLATDMANIIENGGIATVTATLDAVSALPVIINLGYSGTASLSGVDATTAGGNNAVSTTQIVIPAGATSGSISITAVDDLLDETDETVIVAITSVVNAIEATEQQVTTTVTDDDDAPGVSLTLDKLSIAEDGGIATVTASIATASSYPVTINLGYSGTASLSGVDATTAGGNNAVSTTQIVIPAGATSGSISITAVDDLLDENDETVMVAITSVVNAIEATEQQVTVTITDDDTPPNVTLATDKTTIEENGGVATVTAALDAVSALPVTINLAYSGTASLGGTDATTAMGSNALSTMQIIIPAGGTSGTIIITSAEDNIYEGDEDIIIDITSVSNAIEASEQQVSVGIIDNETQPTVILELTGSPFSENNGTATIYAVLSHPSAQEVRVNVVLTGSAIASDYNTSTLNLSIPAGEISAAITITGVDDLESEGDETIIADISTVSNAIEDGEQQVNAVISDNDVAGITVISSGGSTETSEYGTSDSFDVVLNTQPLSDVVINITGLDTSESSIDKTTLTFTNANWDKAQKVTVTGQDDALIDGHIDYVLNLNVDNALSADSYNGLSSGVSVRNLDNDVANITLSKNTLITNEDGTTDEFTVVLTAQPAAAVIVTFTENDDEGTVVGNITFDTDNWNIAQTVTVTPEDDFRVDGNQAYNITVSIDDVNSDDAFDTVADQTITVTNGDNDVADFILSKNTLTTNESGSSDAFTVVLTAQPATDVLITFTENDDEGTVTGSITFNAGNWNNAQTVVVTPEDDALIDGDISYNVTVSIDDATSDDVFDNVADKTVLVTNMDDDLAGYSPRLAGNKAVTSEDATTLSYELKLNAQPASNVVIDIIGLDESEGQLNVTRLTFTPLNWNKVQIITVTGVDDTEVDGHVKYTLSLVVNDALSDDEYDGKSASVEITNLDNDKTNAAPNAVADSAEIGEGTTLNGTSLLANDTDPDGDELIINTTPVSGPSNGVLVIAVDGSYTYTPNHRFFGVETFSYEVCDNGTPQECSTAVVSITVKENTDRDGDGIDNDREGDDDLDADGTPNDEDEDSDGDGISDADEGDIDTDGDGDSDYKDLDSDNDGISDEDEGDGDTDGDGIEDYRDEDSDNDGILDTDEGDVDTDGDGKEDYRDLDSDADGILDADESTGDCDNDSIPDRIDKDKCFDELEVLEGFSPNGDGTNDNFVIAWLDQYNKVSFEVFNRWGNVVYRQDKYENNWNGFSNVGFSIGDELPVGTYYYIIHISDTGEKLNGYIYLNR